jgi:HprK-related kinase B
MSRGADYVSNDRLLIAESDDGPRMAGVPKMPRVNPGTLLNNPDLAGILPDDRRGALRALSREELWAIEEKYDVDVEDCFGAGRLLMEAPLSLFVVLNWNRASGAPFSLRRASLADRPDLLDPIMKPPGPFVVTARDDVPRTIFGLDRNAYLTRLRGVTILEATGRVDFDAACARLLDWEF